MAKSKSLPGKKTQDSFSAKYTAEDILQLYRLRSTEGDEVRLRNIATTMRSLCRMEVEPKIPKPYKTRAAPVKTPFVRDAHHRITSSLVAKNYVVHIEPKDEKKDYRDAANMAERWDLAFTERQNKEQGKDIQYNTTAALVRDGESVLEVVHRPSAWANFPLQGSKDDQDAFKKGADCPIAWTDLDRMNVVYEGGEYGDEWYIKYGEYKKPYLRAKYAMAEDANGRLYDPKKAIEGKPMPEGMQTSGNGVRVKAEFMDADEWHVIIDGSDAPGWPKRNPYMPHLNLFRAPAYELESLLYSLMFLVPRLDELLTMKLHYGTTIAYPTPILKPVPNSNQFPGLDPLGDSVTDTGQGVVKPVRWEPGKLYQPPPGYEILYLNPPPMGQDLNELAQIFKNLIDVAGIPSIMRGSMSGDGSGYLGRQLRDAADMAYRLAVTAQQRQYEKALEFVHWMQPNIIKQTMYIFGWDAIDAKSGKPTTNAGRAYLGLGDKGGKNIADINKIGHVQVQFRPSPPTDLQAAAMVALQLTNAEKPLLGVRDALEKLLQEEDPEGIMDRIWVEDQERNNPEINAMVIESALAEAGIRKPQPVNPLQGFVDQFGQPMQQGGEAVPMAGANVAGMPAVPYINMPGQPGTPTPPQGIPGAPGGRPAGAFPGQPSGPNM